MVDMRLVFVECVDISETTALENGNPESLSISRRLWQYFVDRSALDMPCGAMCLEQHFQGFP